MNILADYPHIANFLYADFSNFGITSYIGIHVIFAMIAALGFGYPFNPPRKIFIGIMAVAGFGYLVRSLLLLFPFFSLAGASFLAALCMGIVAMLVAKRAKVPVEVIVFPCLLPMFPGSYGYKSIISLLTFLQDTNRPEQITHLLNFFHNFITMASVSLSLVAGAMVTFILFFEQSFMITRGSKQASIYTIFRDLRSKSYNKSIDK